MLDALVTATFWIAIAKIAWIDILLSGDNAVVIALASRDLPPDRQRQAIVFGSLGAIVLRIILIFFAVALLDLARSCWSGSASSCCGAKTRSRTSTRRRT